MGSERERRRAARWLAVVVGLCHTADHASLIAVQLFLEADGADPLLIGLNVTLWGLGGVIGGFLWGGISDRLRTAALLALTFLGGALSVAGAVAWLSPTVVLATAFTRALFLSGVSPAAMAILSRESTPESRGRRLVSAAAPRNLGIALGAVFAGFTVQYVGFRNGLAAFMGLLLASLPLLLALRRIEPVPRRVVPHRVRSRMPSGLVRLYLGVLLTMTSMGGCLALAYAYMSKQGLPGGLAGGLGSLDPFVSLIGLTLIGRFVGSSRRRAVATYGFALSGLAPLLFAAARGAPGMAAGFLVVGISYSAWYLGATAHIGDVAPMGGHGRRMGLFYACFALGNVIGPVLAGAVAAALGYVGMFLTMAGVSGIAFLLSFSARGSVRQRVRPGL